jgi:hypothetical protein
MWLNNRASTFLFHKTNIDHFESIKVNGLVPRDPQNPTEQILEFFRQQYHPEKPSRKRSIFFVTTLATFFKTDIGFFGEKIIILGIEFTKDEEEDEDIIADYPCYEYNHYSLMYIWSKIQPRLRNWYPDEFFVQNKQLSDTDIQLLIDEYSLAPSLHEFWNTVQLWDKHYKDDRALYCHQAIPASLIRFKINISYL